VSGAWVFYGLTLLTFLGVNVIACWALDLQFGTAGLLNFGFILFQAAGAYTVALLSLGAPQAGGYQAYFFGTTLPWPLPWIAAMAVGGALAFVTGIFVMGPRRRDYQAIAMLIVSIMVYTVVSNEPRLLNGTSGLSGIPQLFQKLGLVSYGWVYAGITWALVALVYVLVRRIRESPWGRLLRAARENRTAAESLGFNVRKESLIIYVIGGMLAALSGAVLVQFLSAWAPNSWQYAETFVYLTAIVVGGTGSTLGVVLGTLLIQTVVVEGVTFYPGFAAPDLVASLQWITISVLVIVFLWWRPRGILPERKHRFEEGKPQTASSAVVDRLDK